MLSKYQSQKKSLIKAYKQIISSNLFPKEKIEKEIKNLENEEFKLCVAGQIKAGKSTLLNALIFDDEILPSDDTPHTAKITKITYSDTKYFEAIFYSKSEWEKLIKPNGIKHSYYERFIKKDVEKLEERKVYISGYIDKPPKRENDLNMLSQYIAKNGTYTPFVKSVSIGYPNDMLKNIIIVDTPGTNDTNEFRSKMTEDWIGESDAVIYASYSGQTIDKSDIEFIDKYLIHVTPNRCIVAMTKIDLVNKESVKSYVEELKNREDLKGLIFNDKTSFCYICALGALFSTKSVEIPEKHKDRLLDIESKGYIGNNESGMNELELLVESKLMANRGEKILDSHKGKIMSFYESDLRLLEREILEKKDIIKKLLLTNEELCAEEEKNQNAIKNIDNEFKSFKKEMQESMDKIQREISKDFNNIRKSATEKVIKEIDEKDNIGDLFLIKWFIRDRIIDDLAHLKENSEKRVKKFETTIDSCRTNLIEKLINYGIFTNEELELSAKIAMGNEDEKISNEILNTYSNDNMKGIINNVTYFYQRWFNTKSGLKKSKNAIKDKVYKTMDENFFISRKEHLFRSIKKGIEEISNNLQKEIIRTIDKKNKIIQKIKNEQNAGIGNVSNIQEEIKVIEEKKQNINDEKEKIENIIDFKG